MHILIVDDSADTCELMAEYFAIKGHKVTVALNANQALEYVANVQFDAIFLDMVLPDLDGYALAARINRLLAYVTKPILVAISGTAPDLDNPFATEVEFDAYLIKPVSLTAIEATLVRPILNIKQS